MNLSLVLTELQTIDAYAMTQESKNILFHGVLSELTLHHQKKCSLYNRLIGKIIAHPELANEPAPFIPVKLFKQFDLLSIDKSEIVKTMTSSGTSGTRVSKVFLDKATAANQTKALSKIVTSYIGKQRLPLLIIDSPTILKDRELFSARGAGVLGFSIFGRDVEYALNADMQLDLPKIQKFLAKYQNSEILIFGFTFMVWQYLFLELKKLAVHLPLQNAILIHGGGWKKLTDLAVSGKQFKEELHTITGITRIHNYYGMVEQTGSIFIECEQGHLHCSVYSDIEIRDSRHFKKLAFGESGIIQLLSLLPLSYPGHSILTEDIGVILGKDDCACGRLGKYFRVEGRIEHAEIRGCSDVYAQSP
jgi:hypothetical protein